MYAATDFAQMSASALVRTLNNVHGEMARYKAAFILALADFHARGLAKQQGAPSTAVWLRRHLSIGESTSYEYLRLGTRLQGTPLLAQAFLDGEVSYSAVRLVVRYLDDTNEYELLKLASTLTLTELEAVLAGTAIKPERPPKERINMTVDDDGWVKGSFRLNPEHGQALLAPLKIAELANHRDLADIDPEVLSDDNALDEALRDAEQEPVNVDVHPVEQQPAGDAEPDASSPGGFGAPLHRNMLGAFLAMISMVRTSPTSALRAPGTQVNVMVTENGRPYLPENPAARSEDLVAAALNGDVRAHLLDEKGDTLILSKPQRLASDRQVRALLARWGFQCAMPGCNHRRFIEIHHIVFHADGGVTVMWNLVPLCSGCHSLVTDGTVWIDFHPTDKSKLIFGFPGGVQFMSENRSTPLRIQQGTFQKPEPTVTLPGLGFDDADLADYAAAESARRS